MLSGEDCVEVPVEKEEGEEVNPEERRKKKRIEKLEKRIKALQKTKEKAGPKREKFEREASDIKNKHKRQEVVIRRRLAAHTESKLTRLKDRKTREEHGEEAAPKGKTNTIESMRVPDETMMEDANDEDILGEQNIDEFDKYFNREATPKILVTTNRRPRGDIFNFLKELKITIPNLYYYPRENFRIKEIIEWSKEKDFTDIWVFQEKWGKPHSLIWSHLPEGPTATFRVSGVKLNEDIQGHGANNGMMVAPELILNNFDTMLGSRIGRMVASLFP
jgi:ribosome production factor 1